jgi:hypothetical protein
MRNLIASLLVGLGMLSLPSAAHGQQPGNKGVTPEDLVRQLGSRKFAERNAAAAALDTLGAAALPALEVGTKDADLELSLRAAQVRAKIQSRVESVRILRGARLRLEYVNKPVRDAIADLAKRAGYDIQFDGDPATLAGRTVTLDTGETSFWEALGLLCEHAGLVELRHGAEPLFQRKPGGVDMAAESVRPPWDADVLYLRDGKPERVPTWVAGRLRVQARPAAKPHQQGETAFVLTVTPEPSLPWQRVERVQILRATDDRGQSLTQPELFEGGPKQVSSPGEGPLAWDAGSGGKFYELTPDLRTGLVRLTAGKQPATRLTEVRGVLTVKVAVPQPVISVDDVSAVVGKPVRTRTGGSLLVTKLERAGDVVRLDVQLRGFPLSDRRGQPIQAVRTNRGFITISGSAADAPAHLELLDARGLALPVLKVNSEISPNPGGGLMREVTVTYQINPAQVPARLTFSVPSPMTVEVPFVLRDVPLVAASR